MADARRQAARYFGFLTRTFSVSESWSSHSSEQLQVIVFELARLDPAWQEHLRLTE